MSEPSGSQPRRSKRARKQPTDAYDDGSDAEGGVEETKRSPKKRKNTGSRPQETKSKEVEQKAPATRRVRGLLQRLKEFPLDVVFIIFGYLGPQDLLHLARTSKDLRSLLLSRSTISVWKEARSNVEGLPDKPDDMSEPAYAHLCFDAQCHHCDGKHPAVNVFWHDRTRTCNSCFNQSSIYFAGDVHLGHYGSSDTYEGMVLSGYGANEQPLPHDSWRALKYQGDVVRVSSKRRRGYRLFVCSRVTWQQLFKDWENNKQDDAWIERKIAEGKARHEHAQQLKTWWQGRVEEHESELAGRRKAREDAILQRLSDLGWEEELGFQRDRNGLSIFRGLRIGTQAKKLSEKDWNDLRPKLEGALREAKERRLESELRAKWKERYLKFAELLNAELDKLPFNTVGPSVSDYANLPQFQEKLFLPIEHELVEDDLSDLLSQMPQIRGEWLQARTEDLVNELKKCDSMAGATPVTLQLAATIFTCDWCMAQLVYPRPLMHRCSRVQSRYGGGGVSRTEPCFEDFLSVANGRVWKSSIFRLSRRSKVAQDILLAAGLPANATVEDVLKSNIWLDCRLGFSDRHYFMTIVRAMYGGGLEGSGWTVLDVDDAAQAAASASRAYSYDHRKYMCRHCETVLCDSLAVAPHMKDVHQLDGWTPQDVIFHVDTPLTSLEYEPLRRPDPPPVEPPVEVQTEASVPSSSEEPTVSS